MDFVARLMFVATLLITKSVQDIDIGEKGGPRLYEEDFIVTQTHWQRVKNVTIATEEPIARIVITDLNANDIATAKITGGGIGQKNVSIRLETFKVLTGYSFFVELYGFPNSTTTFRTLELPNDTEDEPNKTDVDDRRPRGMTRLTQPKKYGTNSRQDLDRKDAGHARKLIDETLHNKEIKPYYHIGREGISDLDLGGFSIGKFKRATGKVRKWQVVRGTPKNKGIMVKPKANDKQKRVQTRTVLPLPIVGNVIRKKMHV